MLLANGLIVLLVLPQAEEIGGGRPGEGVNVERSSWTAV